LNVIFSKMLFLGALPSSLLFAVFLFTNFSFAIPQPGTNALEMSFQHVHTNKLLESRSSNLSDGSASVVLSTHPILFGQMVAFADMDPKGPKDPVDPLEVIIRLLKAIAYLAATEWKYLTPMQNLNVVMGALQFSLTSVGIITWDIVGAIASQLLTQITGGLRAFFSAILWYEGPGAHVFAIGIGVGLGTGWYLANTLSDQNVVVNAIPPAVPVAQVLAANLFGYVLPFIRRAGE